MDSSCIEGWIKDNILPEARILEKGSQNCCLQPRKDRVYTRVDRGAFFITADYTRVTANQYFRKLCLSLYLLLSAHRPTEH